MSNATITLSSMTSRRVTLSTHTSGFILYLLTLLLELPGVWARTVILGFLFWLVSTISVLSLLVAQWVAAWSGGLDAPQDAGLILAQVLAGGAPGLIGAIASTGYFLVPLVAWWPILASVATLFLPGGFFLKRYSLGARLPSLREREFIDQALAQLTAGEPTSQLVLWRDVFILDKQDLDAFVVGSTLYVTRTLVRSEHLVPVLAHQLAHINLLNGIGLGLPFPISDGRLTLSLRRLILPPVYFLSRALGQLAPGLTRISGADAATSCLAASAVLLLSGLLALAGGGLGLLLLSPAWAWYWRHRTYTADTYAAETLGQRAGLVDYLDTPQLQLVEAPVPYQLGDKPSTELRIDRLQHPQLYPDVERVDVTAVLVSLVGVFVIFCALPTLSSAVTRALNNVEGSWEVIRQCGQRGCDPSTDYAVQRYGYTISFTNGKLFASYIAPNAQYGAAAEGEYSYINADTIAITLTRQDPGMQLALSGQWKIKRVGNTTQLIGSASSYELMQAGSVPNLRNDALVGTWRGENAGETLTIEFRKDATYAISGSRTSSVYNGTYLFDQSQSGTIALPDGSNGQLRLFTQDGQEQLFVDGASYRLQLTRTR